MSTFDDIYSALLARRDSPSELPPLTPSGPYRKSLKADIASLQGSSEVVQAALHLLNDDISAAHDLAQAHEESMTANLVHAVLHRREQDYWNSKWWLSRIQHPLVQSVHGDTPKAKRFVDTVERCEGRKQGSSGSARVPSSGSSSDDHVGEERTALLEVQWKELTGLVEAARAEDGRSPSSRR